MLGIQLCNCQSVGTRVHFLEATVCTKGDHKPAEGSVGLISYGGNAPQSLVPSCNWSSYPWHSRGPCSGRALGGMLLSRCQTAGSAQCLSLRLGQLEVVAMPAGGVCWIRSCGQVTELWEEMNRLYGIREDGKGIDGVFTEVLQR